MERLLHSDAGLEELDDADRDAQALHEAVEAYRRVAAPEPPTERAAAPCEAQKLLAHIRSLCIRMYQRAHEPRPAREKAALANLIFEAIHELNHLGFTKGRHEPPSSGRATMEEQDDFSNEDTQPDFRPIEEQEMADSDRED